MANEIQQPKPKKSVRFRDDPPRDDPPPDHHPRDHHPQDYPPQDHPPQDHPPHDHPPGAALLYPPDPMMLVARKVPKTTKAMIEQGFFSQLHGSPEDEFGTEPVRKKLLPSYYYDAEDEEDPMAKKFPVLGKTSRDANNNTTKRHNKTIKIEEPIKTKTVCFAHPNNNFEIVHPRPLTGLKT